MSFPFLDFESSFFTNEELLFLAGASGGGVEYTIINNPATFTTDLSKPLRRLVIPFTPVQSGSGDPSPDNVRPITGWTGVNINRTGKNLLNPIAENMIYKSASAMSVAYGDAGEVTVYYPSDSANFIVFKVAEITESLVGVTFVFSGTGTADSDNFLICDSDGGNRSVKSKSYTVQSADIGRTIAVRLWRDVIGTCSFSELQAEIGATASEYVPYSGTTIPVSWQTEAGEVYGGELDALTGVLTVTHKFIDITNVDWLWVKSSSYPGGFYASIQTNNIGIKAQTDFICSHAKIAHILSEYEYGTCYCDGSVNIRIMQSDSELSDWQTYLSEQSQNGTPVCICGELETPYTVQLDPVTLSTLIGENVVWTDTNGDNTIVYLKKT